jgi:hypothetical protein
LWNQAEFPVAARNGTQQGEEDKEGENSYEDSGPNSPFDQPFLCFIAAGCW